MRDGLGDLTTPKPSTRPDINSDQGDSTACLTFLPTEEPAPLQRIKYPKASYVSNQRSDEKLLLENVPESNPAASGREEEGPKHLLPSRPYTSNLDAGVHMVSIDINIERRAVAGWAEDGNREQLYKNNTTVTVAPIVCCACLSPLLTIGA